MRPSISSQHSRPPHYPSSARQEDELLLREWLLVLKGDGESPRTIENYRGSVGMLVGFLAAGGFPLLMLGRQRQPERLVPHADDPVSGRLSAGRQGWWEPIST